MYGADDLDLAGFALGIVERDGDRRRLRRRRRRCRDRAGRERTARQRLHARAAAAGARRPGPDDAPGDLLAPTRIYARAAAGLRAACDVRAMAHITGGGLPGNLPRVLPAGLGARVDERRWPAPARLRLARRAGRGARRDAPRLQRRPRIPGRRARGRGGGGDRRPRSRRAARPGRSARSCRARASSTRSTASAVRLGVLVSGSGSNLQALIERVHGRAATIVGVCSSNDEAFALERARAAGIESAVFALAAHGGERERRDRAMADWLGRARRRARGLRRVHGRAERGLPRALPRPRPQPASLAAAGVSGRERDRGRLFRAAWPRPA